MTVDYRLIDRAIFRQTAIYFMRPLFLVIYGGYFLATFIGSRKMIVREERNE